jgi:hypothetical protein
MIKSLHKKFHNFISSDYLVMIFAMNYTFYYFLKNEKKVKPFLTRLSLTPSH